MGVEEVSTETKTNQSGVSVRHGVSLGVNSYDDQCLKSKMEAMQRRIEELKEKVKSEGDLLQSEEALLKTETLGNDKFFETFTDVESNSEPAHENDDSEKSLYFSASNNSLCSLSTNSTDSSYYNFTKLVSNFVNNLNQKERLSLLQLHSNKQISQNLMRNSLSELNSRCSEELELVGRSLHHLNQLAAEFNVDRANCKSMAVEFFHTNFINNGKLKSRFNQTFICPPLKSNTTIHLDWSNNQEFIKPIDKKNSTI